ncbi:hypothetical protein A3A46_01110 [Candidatus Roizmanbacteria bacterium RIFCSPLOWO2_01_FULL_37_13]|uniref:Uncharacterized protein n=1 Tax=Candidatus Roizmanbacteria bacterium RIFCSPHIGHO2_02_FULL_38_11 TaxID=1802039 RepID=A0A1F7H0P2_9BACT|nr:MAG: hypothetical protein A3C25_06055 [Candidatus Roizmanbacteria bacterium RIFCSPHIGHO2_02_FULL_38_11]OGK41539.1 MAG: hypothetical protein A3A46_01110 [Candidatus Roizmanbacteria bacterium RIFCSPLOWO2_01_FULL_37_13]
MTDQNNQDMARILEKIKNVAQQGMQAAGPEDQKKSFESFVEQLIEERSFPDLTPEVRVELKKDLINRLDSFIAAKVIVALSDEDVLKFEQMLKDNKPAEELQKFTVEHVPDFTTFLTNVLLEFRGVYLGLIQAPVSLDVDLVGAAKQVKKPQSMPPAPAKPSFLPPAPVPVDKVN